MGTRNPKKPGRLDPTTRQEWFKTSVEDSVMALIASDSPTRTFTTGMVVRGKQDEFDRTKGRLCDLGCHESILFYCLIRLKSAPENGRLSLPSVASLKKLARRMENLAEDIKKMESTGVLDPLDEEELSDGNFHDIVSGDNWAWIRTLPNSLERRAGMYKRCSEKFPVSTSGKTSGLRRDLISRVNRLCLAVYVKLATNNHRSSYGLVAQLMRCVGEPADRSQLKRDLEHFESMHFQAHNALQDKLQRIHDAAPS